MKAKRKQQRLSGVVCCGLADILRCYTQLRLTAVLFRVCFAMPSFGALGHTLSTSLIFAVAFLCVSFVSQGECQATQAPPTRKYKWSFKNLPTDFFYNHLAYFYPARAFKASSQVCQLSSWEIFKIRHD